MDLIIHRWVKATFCKNILFILQSQILHIVDPKRHSPSPPPPFPRTTSEVESHVNLRFTRVSPPTPPEYDEPPRDLDSSSMPPSQRDRAPCGYQSHDEEAVTERVRHRSGGFISRHSSERRSHKESKKKTRVRKLTIFFNTLSLVLWWYIFFEKIIYYV